MTAYRSGGRGILGMAITGACYTWVNVKCPTETSVSRLDFWTVVTACHTWGLIRAFLRGQRSPLYDDLTYTLTSQMETIEGIALIFFSSVSKGMWSTLDSRVFMRLVRTAGPPVEESNEVYTHQIFLDHPPGYSLSRAGDIMDAPWRMRRKRLPSSLRPAFRAPTTIPLGGSNHLSSALRRPENCDPRVRALDVKTTIVAQQ
jgi:hypothetical protein